MDEERDLVTFYARDPALSEMPRDWRDGDRDPAAVPAKLDPVVYTFRRLSRKQRRTVYHGGTDEERGEYAFLCGIRGAHGGRFGGAGWLNESKAIHLDEDAAEKVFTPDELVDVGRQILRASMMGKGFAGPWPPSPTFPPAPDGAAPPSAEPSRE